MQNLATQISVGLFVQNAEELENAVPPKKLTILTEV